MSSFGTGFYGTGFYGTGEASTPGSFTQRLYDGLPTLYRDVDQNGDLLAFLRLLGDQADEIETLLERINYDSPDDGGAPGDTSDLADPATADAAWLPWLTQLVGVRAPASGSEQGLRDAIAYATTGWRAGTRDAIAGAAKSALTGSRYVHVYDHSISVPGDGGAFDILLVTRVSETPDVPAVLQAVVDGHAKPAGVVLHHRAYTSTWATEQSTYPTWADRNGLPWYALEEAGL